LGAAHALRVQEDEAVRRVPSIRHNVPKPRPVEVPSEHARARAAASGGGERQSMPLVSGRPQTLRA